MRFFYPNGKKWKIKDFWRKFSRPRVGWPDPKWAAKNYPNRPGSNIFDPDPSLALVNHCLQWKKYFDREKFLNLWCDSFILLFVSLMITEEMHHLIFNEICLFRSLSCKTKWFFMFKWDKQPIRENILFLLDERRKRHWIWFHQEHKNV